MSIRGVEDGGTAQAGFPELTPLGKRIEMLRMERRMTKRELARRAETSRQQLWRVMTGKSELTSSLSARLAEVLGADSRLLTEASDGHPVSAVYPSHGGRGPGRVCLTLAEYVATPDCLARTLDTLPTNDEGRRLKRALLNAVEDVASDSSLELATHFFELRRAVVNGGR